MYFNCLQHWNKWEHGHEIDEFGLTQSTFTCSNLIIETLEQGEKYVQS